ncbi:MAG: methyltransferase domain-containing protein [Deltaproteobacteria bacterium]|nr:methyltransferase domain-containing protein [Deltaproteobacteria bacterium]
MDDAQWINKHEVPELKEGEKVLLFGAGHGSEEMIAYFRKRGLEKEIVGLIDNDPCMWGKRLLGFPIFEPGSLTRIAYSMIIITSISGRDAIAHQLREMGLIEGIDFFKVGRYPHDVLGKLTELVRYDSKLGFMKGLETVAHIGSGGFFGFELSLLSLWSEFVFSIDAYLFNASFPDVSEHKTAYAKCLEDLGRFAREHDLDANRCTRRWSACFQERGGRTYLNAARMSFLYPHRFSQLPLESEQVDMVTSFGVLEHVRNPRRAAAESFRILRKGGIAYHNVITRDHRSFGRVEGYTPLSYRSCSEAEWDRINANKFYQNRVAPWQWKEFFLEAGFDLLLFDVLHEYEPDGGELSRFHADFARWSDDLQRQVDCVLIARRPS